MRLEANLHYWDTKRGPRRREVVFRNDLPPERALELVCSTEGEVDIVTEVPPAEATWVEGSAHAKLVAIDAIRSIVGIIDREAEGLPLGDKRARLALNRAIDRKGLVEEAMFGRAKPLAGLTPPSRILLLDRVLRPLFVPHPHNPARAAELWEEAGGVGSRPIRVASPAKLEPVALKVAADLEGALGVRVDVNVLDSAETREARRRLAERAVPRGWDVLIWEQGPQAADGPPLELHRAFVGELGEYRTGPVVPEFEALYAELVGKPPG